jgi:hypothetical protein
VDATADLPCWRGRLVDHRLQTEQVHVERHGGGVSGGDCEVAGVLQRDQPFLLRRLDRRAGRTLRPRAAAVADVVQLKDDAARIGNEQFARAVRRAAGIRPPRPHERLLRPRLGRGRRRVRHSVRRQRLQRAIDGEVLHAEAECADARALAGGRRLQRQETRAVADAQQHRRALARLNRHPEQPLVEVHGTRHVRHGQRDLAQAVDAEPGQRG